MSYTGVVRPLLNCYPFNKSKDHPKILEIGIDKGQSLFPIVQNLSSRFPKFLYYGVDVLVRDQMFQSLCQFHDVSIHPMDEMSGRDVIISEQNSLDWLQKNQKSQTHFDIVFLDGDHNYYTVSHELRLLQNVIHPQSIIVCDDFNGRHAFKDSFYGERDEYKDVKSATRKIETGPNKNVFEEAAGVKPAVLNFVESNKNWSGFQWDDLEPCILYRNDVWEELETPNQSYGNAKELRDVIFNFRLKNNSVKFSEFW